MRLLFLIKLNRNIAVATAATTAQSLSLIQTLVLFTQIDCLFVFGSTSFSVHLKNISQSLCSPFSFLQILCSFCENYKVFSINSLLFSFHKGTMSTATRCVFLRFSGLFSAPTFSRLYSKKLQWQNYEWSSVLWWFLHLFRVDFEMGLLVNCGKRNAICVIILTSCFIWWMAMEKWMRYLFLIKGKQTWFKLISTTSLPCWRWERARAR